MAVAIDSEMAAQTGARANPTVSSLTFSFTNGAGTLLIVGGECTDGADLSPFPKISGVTYSAVALTKVGGIGWFTNAVPRSEATIWKLLSPATGANNVVISVAAPAVRSIIGGALSVTGNDTTTPTGNVQSAFNDVGDTTPTVNVPTTASSSMIVDCMGTGSLVSTSGQTLSWKLNGASDLSGDNAAQSRAPGNGGTVTMSYTVTLDVWGIIACEIFAAATTGWGALLNVRRNRLVQSY